MFLTCHLAAHLHLQPVSGGQSIEKRLLALRGALAECTARNEEAPELERVRGGSFVDTGWVGEDEKLHHLAL